VGKKTESTERETEPTPDPTGRDMVGLSKRDPEWLALAKAENRLPADLASQADPKPVVKAAPVKAAEESE